MLAKLQRLFTLALLAAALGWLLYFRAGSPGLAIAGFLTLTFGYTVFLAFELLLVRSVGKSDTAPRPTAAELFSAWAGEVIAAPQVFCWRQPFRANAVPDQLLPEAVFTGKRGVVFVHGLLCNRGFWTPWLRRLRGGGHAFIALDLEPPFGSIDAYTPQIDAAVRTITALTGLPPLVVCHSMGGLAARAWLKIYAADARIHHVVTIGSPHRGTWLARYGHGHNARQMRLQSEWQAQLDQGMPPGRHALFTCWYSNTDNIVFPASNATLPDAENRLLRGAAHVHMAFLPQVIDATLALLNDAPT